MADDLRVGIGFDAHAFADGRPLVLAGVEVPHARGLAGHSDADLIAHAVTDALLGAAGGDIGSLFPSDDPGLEGASSIAARGLDRLAGRAGGSSTSTRW
jgi:2-C-methyl-D-erythritol 2,4-cyclodiphosphate synthase